jgi:SAM-dependent methyltransferase
VTVTWLPDVYSEYVASEELLGVRHPHNPLVHQILWGDLSVESELVERYEALHPIWTSWAAKHQARYTLPLATALSGAPRWSTLELSAGTGQGTGLVGSVASCMVCTEPSRSMAAELKDRTRAMVVRAGSLLPFVDASFQRVVGLNAVMCASEVRRVLAPGGVAVVCYSFAEQTPAFISPEELSRALGMPAVCQRVGFGLSIVLSNSPEGVLG